MKVERLNDLDTIVVDNGSEIGVVVLHGYGANFQDLAPLYQHLDPSARYNWYFIDAPHSVDVGMGMMGKAWFPIDMMKLQQSIATGRFEEMFVTHIPTGLEESITKVQGAIQEIDVSDLYIGGFSQGSMVSMGLALRSPESVKKLFLMSSTLCDEAGLTEKIDGIKEVPIFQSHGRMDPVLPFPVAERLQFKLEEKVTNYEFHPFNGGHEIPMEVISRLKIFLEK